MNIYEITNITDRLGKRDANFNKTLKISYIDDMFEKTLNLKPSETIYFQIDSLPLSVRKYKVKNLVSVREISEGEFSKIKENNNSKSKPASSKKTTTTTTTTKKPKSTSRKKSTTKSVSSTKSKSSYSRSTTTTTTENNEDDE